LAKDVQSGIDEPNLLERTFAAGCRSVAIVSLHPGAGARTVVEAIAAESARRGVPTGVTRAPRLPLDADEVTDELTRISLPAGTVVATTRALAADHDGLESVDDESSSDELALYRCSGDGDVPVYGPDDPGSMRDVLVRLADRSGGLALADGAWERRGFAAPGIADGSILVLGSGFSGSPERSAAALSYVTEILSVSRCDDVLTDSWTAATEVGAPVAVDGAGRELERLRRDCTDPVSRLEEWRGRLAAVLLPDGLHDSFLAPMTRSQIRCPLVVQDATRIHIAPIYYKSWLRGGGSVQAVEPMRVLAVATNPVNASGPDVDADRFRDLVVDALPGVPVHDVLREAAGREKKSSWKFWA
jgi:hypothetical protein